MKGRGLKTTRSGSFATLRMAFFWLGAAYLLALPVNALATHEVDHRYVIYGEVRYENGAMVSNVPVELLGGDDTRLTQVETDEFGRFRILLHLHNEDLGKKFDIAISGQRLKATIEFDPEDKTTERKQRFDFTIENP